MNNILAFDTEYNKNKEIIPKKTKNFLQWFEDNRLNISNANISNEESLDIDDYLNDFDKELTNEN